MSDIKKTQYWFYRVRGVCTNCGKEDAFTINGRSRCAECTEKKNAKQRQKLKDNPIERNKNIEYCKSRYSMLKQSCICTKCGTRKTRNGKSRCERCLAHDRIIYELHKPEYVGYFDETTCRRCKKAQPISGKKLCESCYNKAISALQIANSNQDRSKHIWKNLNNADFRR